MNDPVAQSARLFVISGAPGSGKTAVIERLREKVAVVDEPARAVLGEQRSTGGKGTWDQDATLFVRLLLHRAIADHREATARGSAALFDRGIPDCAVYAARAGVDPGPSLDASERYRYEEPVLFFEPWREIYTTDEERTLTFEGAAEFGGELREVYARCGYEVVAVPRGSLAERVAFVRNLVAPS